MSHFMMGYFTGGGVAIVCYWAVSYMEYRFMVKQRKLKERNRNLE